MLPLLSTVMFSRDDGHVQGYRIEEEDDADPEAASTC
jgi:hypothetical protein